MTPREIKEQIYLGVELDDPDLVFAAAKEFYAQGLWTSTAHYDPIEPNGTESLIRARRPGTCSLCHREFAAGQLIRWRSRVDCHAACWDKQFA